MVIPILTHSRDVPPHLDSDSALKITSLKVSESLKEVKGPIDNIPENAKIINFKSEKIFSSHDWDKCKVKLWVISTINYGYDYLRQLELKQGYELTVSD